VHTLACQVSQDEAFSALGHKVDNHSFTFLTAEKCDFHMQFSMRVCSHQHLTDITPFPSFISKFYQLGTTLKIQSEWMRVFL